MKLMRGRSPSVCGFLFASWKNAHMKSGSEWPKTFHDPVTFPVCLSECRKFRFMNNMCSYSTCCTFFYGHFLFLRVALQSVREMRTCLSVCHMVQLENCRKDLYEIWYGLYANGNYLKRVLFSFATIDYIKMANEQTCEVESILAIWQYNNARL